MIRTVMLAMQSFATGLPTDSEFLDQDRLRETGKVRLDLGWQEKLAEAAARNIGGTMKRFWFDGNAGGYFADIEINGSTACPGGAS